MLTLNEAVKPEVKPNEPRLSPVGADFVHSPRDEFISQFLGEITVDGEGIEAQLNKDTYKTIKLTGDARIDANIRRCATYYSTLSTSGARLPKFTRWVASLYPKEASIVEAFSRLGQNAVKEKYIISGDEVDIRRCADTPHFYSCFKEHTTPGKICQIGVGICIIYTDDDNGKMKRRTWGLHVKSIETDKDGLLVCAGRYGNFDEMQIVNELKQRHPDVDFYVRADKYGGKKHTVKLATGFTKDEYFDYPLTGSIYAEKV